VPRQHQRMFIHFKNLYINRIQHYNAMKQLGQGSSDDGSPRPDDRKPYVSEKSKQYAANQRKKKLGDGGKKVNIVSILLHPGNAKADLSD